MAVPCRRCGRGYDVTLFDFGRTIWCTCGERVGIEPRVRAAEPSAEPRFAADAMLGRLARWLRLLGFDCAYDPDFTDEGLVRVALEEGRTVLTRDRRLPEEWWVENVHLVQHEGTRAQLTEVVRHFRLTPWMRPLTRCSDCNRALLPAAPQSVADRVPPRVLAHHGAFSACPSCGRVYWEGTHAGRIRALAADLAAEA